MASSGKLGSSVPFAMAIRLLQISHTISPQTSHTSHLINKLTHIQARTEGAPSREVYVADTGRHVTFTDPVQRGTDTWLLLISFAPPRETTFVSVNLAPGKMVAVAAQNSWVTRAQKFRARL